MMMDQIFCFFLKHERDKYTIHMSLHFQLFRQKKMDASSSSSPAPLVGILSLLSSRTDLRNIKMLRIHFVTMLAGFMMNSHITA